MVGGFQGGHREADLLLGALRALHRSPPKCGTCCKCPHTQAEAVLTRDMVHRNPQQSPRWTRSLCVPPCVFGVRVLGLRCCWGPQGLGVTEAGKESVEEPGGRGWGRGNGWERTAPLLAGAGPGTGTGTAFPVVRNSPPFVLAEGGLAHPATQPTPSEVNWLLFLCLWRRSAAGNSRQFSSAPSAPTEYPAPQNG